MPLFAGVGGLIVIGVLGWFLFFRDDAGAGGGDEVSAAENTGEAATQEPVAPEEPVEAAEETAEEPEAADEGGETADAGTDEPAKPRTKDPSEIDLAAIPDFGPAPETDEETWAQMNEWMAAFMDPDSGIRGTRGRDSLQELGRQAIPVVINYMKDLDYATEEGMRNGDVAQKLLREICRGNNFDWKYETGPNEQWFNRRVVELWASSWRQAATNVDAWIKLGKIPPEEQAELRDELGGLLDSAAEQAAEDDPFGELDIDD